MIGVDRLVEHAPDHGDRREQHETLHRAHDPRCLEQVESTADVRVERDARVLIKELRVHDAAGVHDSLRAVALEHLQHARPVVDRATLERHVLDLLADHEA